MYLDTKSELDNTKTELNDIKASLLPNMYEEYYNNKYPKTDITYGSRPIIGVGNRCAIDLRDFFNKYDSEIRNVVNGLMLADKTDDEKAIMCLRWVLSNVKYALDNTVGYSEYWKFAYETLASKLGDCEDQSILLSNIMLIAGIPYWKIRLTAGKVDDGQGNTGGHCFVTYFCESKGIWVLLDCTYYPNFDLLVTQRQDYKDEPYYAETWFSWNEKYCFAKDTKDIEKLITQI